MRIGEIAERTGLNISNVRFYERKGLLTPERETGSKYRDYSEEDVNRIKKILLYRKMGIPVDTIYLILKDKQDITDIILRQQKELFRYQCCRSRNQTGFGNKSKCHYGY